MPWTLYRYILWDLVKLLAVSTTVLVLVISFAAAIKPMSEGLLSAPALLKFVGYTAPTMLAFVLPFAGAFASTLVFLRLSSDNEVTAMAASGLSYASILTPVIALGLALTMSLFYLSNFVIPRFYRAAAQTVEVDLMSVLVTRLNRNQPFDMEDAVIYADAAVRHELTEEERELVRQRRGEASAPVQQVELTGVAVGQFDENNRLRNPITANRATVWLYRDEADESSSITLALRDLIWYDPVALRFFYNESKDILRLELPSPFRDQPEFLSWRDLRRLRDAPERYGSVRRLKDDLADAVAAEKLRLLVLGQLRGEGEAGEVFLESGRPGLRYAVSAPRARRDGTRLVLEGNVSRPVVIRTVQEGQTPRRFEASSAAIDVARSVGATEPGLTPRLYNARVYSGDERQFVNEQPELQMPRMYWPEPVLDFRVEDLNAYETMAIAQEPPFERAGSVNAAARALWDQITRLGYKIRGQLHQRAASAVACLLVLLLGALLSIRYRNQLSLVVYFWAFTLAIVTTVIIHTGTNLAGNQQVSLVVALLILWAGNIALAAVAAGLYCQIARN